MENILMGLALVILMGALAARGNTKKEPYTEKHPVLHVIAWILTAIGILSLIGHIFMILKASNKAEMSYVINPAIFIIFGVAAYLFNYKKSASSIIEKIAKVVYITVLIFVYSDASHQGQFYSTIFYILVLIGFLRQADYFEKISRNYRKISRF